MKSIMSFLSLLIVVAALALDHRSNGAASSASKSTPSTEATLTRPQQAGIVDGAVTPELIPDRVAYSLMFRLIANRRTPEEKGRIRAYLRHIGLGDADIDGLIAAAEEFHQGVNPLDGQAKQIKASNRGITTAELKGHLMQLQHRKDAIVDHIVVTLPLRLSRDAISKLQQHIAEHVKPLVRFQPN